MKDRFQRKLGHYSEMCWNVLHAFHEWQLYSTVKKVYSCGALERN